MDCDVADQEKLHFWWKDSFKPNLRMLRKPWRKIICWGSVSCGLMRPNWSSGHRDITEVWGKKVEAFNPKNTVPTVKHGGGTGQLWGRFCASATRNLVKVDGFTNKEKRNVDILKETPKPSAVKLGLNSCFIFQHDNNPKHVAWWRSISRRPWWMSLNGLLETLT